MSTTGMPARTWRLSHFQNFLIELHYVHGNQGKSDPETAEFGDSLTPRIPGKPVYHGFVKC
jgi:hypothetical protein